MAGDKNVAFYITGHQDDWQLFMTPQSYHDLQPPGNKIVFIYLTAGDAGKGTAWWKARRAGAISSIQFALREKIAPVEPVTREFNGHNIVSYEVRNSTSYFINIPDGSGDGKGFPETCCVSLEKFHDDTICNVSALTETENSRYKTAYFNWSDLTVTLKEIMDTEIRNEKREHSWLNILDPCEAGHSDHRYTGIAVENAVNGDGRYKFSKYFGYKIKSKSENVAGRDLMMKTGMYLFYNQTAFEMSGGEDHLSGDYVLFLPQQHRV